MSYFKAVSKCIIQKSSSPISNLKLQKLLYYVQGWSLALYNRPAFEERIEAWVHGPVVPAAFAEYRHYGWNSIDIPQGPLALTAEEISHVENVLAAYGGFTATQLEHLSHKEKPWLDARGNLDAKAASKAEITQASMKDFFVTLANA